MSSVCWDPWVIRISSGSTEKPNLFSYLPAIHSLRGIYPSDVAYWSAAQPSSESTCSAAFATPAVSRKAGLGSPPANEMMSGRSVTFRISLIIDRGVERILLENRYGVQDDMRVPR